MKEDDPLNSVLREWEAAEPSPLLDARVRAAYRANHGKPWWSSIWSARVTIPVPVLATLLLVMAALWWQFGTSRAKPQSASPGPVDSGYVTRLEAAGFQPLQNGATRIVRSGEMKQ